MSRDTGAVSRRPRRIVTGPFTWRIEWVDLGGEHYGETDQERLLIRMQPDLAPEFERETLMHELLHACYRTAGIDSTVEREEQIVSGISPFLLDALRRSPGLAAYLLGD